MHFSLPLTCGNPASGWDRLLQAWAVCMCVCACVCVCVCGYGTATLPLVGETVCFRPWSCRVCVCMCVCVCVCVCRARLPARRTAYHGLSELIQDQQRPRASPAKKRCFCLLQRPHIKHSTLLWFNPRLIKWCTWYVNGYAYIACMELYSRTGVIRFANCFK